MAGVATGKRGDGRGEEKGDAVEDFVRESGPSPGAALEGLGEPTLEVGVPALCSHGAGDIERAIVTPRTGGAEDLLSVALFHCHSAPSTASSSALPFSDVGALLSSSSSLSVFSSSPSSPSSSTGLHMS